MSSMKSHLQRFTSRWRIHRFDKRQAKRALVDREAAEHIDRLEHGISDPQKLGI